MAEITDVHPDVLERARRIKLFLMDVDGTITDGGVCLIAAPEGAVGGPAETPSGPVLEMKVFNAADGLGLKLAHVMGIRTGFITGRKSPAVESRAKDSHVDYVYLGQAIKMSAYEECLRLAGVTAEETAYMGDDLPDMPVMRRSGLAVAVADAAPEVKAVSHYVTRSLAGKGTAREVVELILKAQGRWEEAIPQALA